MKSWFDLRAILLAGALAIAAALPYITSNSTRRDYYFFDVALTSTSPGQTQLFWDIGHGYTEYDSSRQPLKIESRPVVYRYMMPMGEIKALRLDPIDGEGDFTFAHAQIVDFRGNVVRQFSPSDFRAANDIARMAVFGDTLHLTAKPGARDVVLELNLPEPIHLRSNLRIWLILGLPVALAVFIPGVVLGVPRLASAVQRCLQRVSPWLQQHPRATIAVVALIAVVVQCHPVVFFGRSFASPNNGSLMLYGGFPTLPGETDYVSTNTMSSDTGALLFNHMYYPMVAREALKHGELPLWHRFSLCGMPLLGQGQSMFGDPVNFITILANGAAWAWDLRFLIARWLFAAGLAFTVWRLTRHLLSAGLVAVGSAFIAYYTYRINHPANFSVCYSALILWAWTGLIHATDRRRQAGWLAALILANWMVMTSGTVKEAYMIMVCLNLAGVILLGLLPAAEGRRGHILALATGAGAVFTLLSAPLWISFLVALKHSFTVYDLPTAHTLPPGHLIGFFDDIFYRQTSEGEVVVAPALNFFLMLGVLWWLVSPRLWRADRAGLALVLGAMLPLSMAFGLIPPALIAKIPFVANIHHIYNTFSCPLMVVAIVLAGCGFRDALDGLREKGWNFRLGLLFALVAILLIIFFLSDRSGYKPSDFFLGHAPALIVGLVALPLGLLWSVRTNRAGPVLVAVVLGLPLLLWRHCQFTETFFNSYAFVPGLRSDLHAPSAGVDYIDRQAREPGRRIGWGNSLFPAYHIALNWEGLYGVDTLRNRYYQELATEFDMRRVWVWDWANKLVDAQRLVPIHDLLNVDYSIADTGTFPPEFAGLKQVQQLDLAVYLSSNAWPRAFFTDRLAQYDTVHDFAVQVQTGDGRPFATAQTGQTDRPQLPAALGDRTVQAATDYKLTANKTTFTINAPGPGIAVLTEAYYEHDFHVTMDGKPVPYFRVNHAFKGVAIPTAGRHEITFAYWPLYTSLSLWLAAAGAVFAGGAGIFMLRRPRQADGV
jgi:hypothetical protein